MKVDFKLVDCESVDESFGLSDARYNEIIRRIEKTVGKDEMNCFTALSALYEMDLSMREFLYCTYKIAAITMTVTNPRNLEHQELINELHRRIHEGEINAEAKIVKIPKSNLTY